MAADDPTQKLLTTIELLKAENRELQASLDKVSIGVQHREEHESFFQQWASRLTRPERNDDIHQALAALNLYLDIDFLTLFDFDAKTQSFSYQHGYPPRDPEATDANTPALKYPWILQQVRQNHTVVIYHRDELPQAAHIDLQTLTEHDIEALIVVPHYDSNGLVGIGTYGMNRTRFRWQRSHVKLLEDFTKIGFSHIAQQALLNDKIVSSDLLQTVLDSVQVGFSMWEKGRRDVTYSDNCATLLGYEKSEAIDVFSHIHPDDQAKVRDTVSDSIRTGKHHDFNFRVIAKDQKIHWYQQKSCILRTDEMGQVQRLVNSFVNIDEEISAKQEKVKIRKLEAQLASLVIDIHGEHTNEKDTYTRTIASLANLVEADRCFICYRKPEHTKPVLLFQWFNDKSLSIESIFESLPAHTQAYQAKGLPVCINKITRTHADIIPRQDTSKSAFIIPLLAIQNSDVHLVLERSTADSPWGDADKRFATTIADALALRYVRTKLTMKLRRSEQRFREAMETTQDGIWEWNLDDNSVYLSPGLFRIVGYSPNELPHSGATLRNLVHPDEAQRVTDEFHKLKKNEVPFEDGMLRWISKSGKTVWVYGRARCSERRADGSIRRIVAVVSDYTRVIKQQESLKAAIKSADDANIAKSEFLARMSHEIRTPMNAIIGMTHLAKDTALDAQQQGYLDHIDQAAQSLLHIINEVLDFSKIEAGKLLLEHFPFRFESLFDQIDRLLGIKAHEKNLELLFESDPNIPELLVGDSLRLGQILINLVSNAIKFTPAGQVFIKAELKDQDNDNLHIQFSITDTGIGVSKEQGELLFQPFTQADGSTTRQFGGSGLGLSICKRLVNLMQGEISFVSQPGKGSCFVFDVSLKHCSDANLVSRTAPKLSALRTLIVDDNPTAREVINATAKSLHLNTTTIDSGEAAIEKLRTSQQSYDLILMDYAMPGLNGINTSRAIKAFAQPSPPMIIMVSAGDREQIVTAENSDVIDGFVSKPVTQSRLYNAITRVLGTQPSAESGQPESRLNDWATLHHRKVLLVEDNLVNQKVAEGLLRKQQVECTIANNGQEAIDLLLTKGADYFAAILMDVEMPLVDGYQATRFIRQMPAFERVPIVAMTAHAMTSDQQKCFDAGMDAFVHKPIKPQVLYQTLADQLFRHDGSIL